MAEGLDFQWALHNLLICTEIQVVKTQNIGRSSYVMVDDLYRPDWVDLTVWPGPDDRLQVHNIYNPDQDGLLGIPSQSMESVEPSNVILLGSSNADRPIRSDISLSSEAPDILGVKVRISRPFSGEVVTIDAHIHNTRKTVSPRLCRSYWIEPPVGNTPGYNLGLESMRPAI